MTDRVAIGSAMPREGRSPGRRRLSRPARLTLGFLAASASVGLLASLYAWLTLEPDIGAPRPAVVLAGVGVAVGTMANLLLRFLRWQYLLRRFGVRVAAPASLGAFVGSFAFLPIPLYVGQLIARDPARDRRPGGTTRLSAARVSLGAGARPLGPRMRCTRCWRLPSLDSPPARWS